MATVLEMCRDLETARFAPGEVLLPEGGKTGCLYVLVSGKLEVCKGTTPITTLSEPGRSWASCPCCWMRRTK